jgi:DNA excision repair protein ERCC-2
MCAEVVRFTPTNVGIFVASYEVLEGILEAGLESVLDRPVFCERMGMASRENERLIRDFKSKADKGGAVLMGVQGGRSSEGVDYPDKTMLTVVIVGVPYVRPTPRIRAQARFYEKFSGRGRELAYVLPAMRKASQAAGRPVRSLSDRGVAIFLDYRFSTTYCKRFLPYWISRAAKVLPVDDEALAKELILFYGI